MHRADKRNFVYEVAGALNEATARDEFDRLILVAPAHALGELNHALDAPTQRKIVAQLQKDLTNVPNADLAKHLSDLINASGADHVMCHDRPGAKAPALVDKSNQYQWFVRGGMSPA